jgi:hypothetical protein
MTGPRELPAWVSPFAAEVRDLQWLAYREWTERQSPWIAGVIATAAWVSGEGRSPLNDDGKQPVTKALAFMELEHAESVDDAEVIPDEQVGDVELHSLEPVAIEVGKVWIVPPPPPRIRFDEDDELGELVMSRAFGAGVRRTLGWLLGVGGEFAPLPVPVRDEDGTIPTVEEHYETIVVTESLLGNEQPTHQQLHVFREDAESDVRRWWRLAQRIEETTRGYHARPGSAP